LVPLVLSQGLRPATPLGRVGGLRTGLSGEPNPSEGGDQSKTWGASSQMRQWEGAYTPAIERTTMPCISGKDLSQKCDSCISAAGLVVRLGLSLARKGLTEIVERRLGASPPSPNAATFVTHSLRSGLTYVPVASPDKCRAGLVTSQ